MLFRSITFISVANYTSTFNNYRVNSWSSVCPHGISSKLDHFRLMSERTNCSHTILEVEHLSVSIICVYFIGSDPGGSVLKSVFHIPKSPLYLIQFQDKNYLYIMYSVNLAFDCLPR